MPLNKTFWAKFSQFLFKKKFKMSGDFEGHQRSTIKFFSWGISHISAPNYCSTSHCLAFLINKDEHKYLSLKPTL